MESQSYQYWLFGFHSNWVKFSKIVYWFCKNIWKKIAVLCENSLIWFTSQKIKIQFSFHKLEFYATVWHNEISHKCQLQIKTFWHFSFCKITPLFLSGFKMHVKTAESLTRYLNTGSSRRILRNRVRWDTGILLPS